MYACMNLCLVWRQTRRTTPSAVVMLLFLSPLFARPGGDGDIPSFISGPNRHFVHI